MLKTRQFPFHGYYGARANEETHQATEERRRDLATIKDEDIYFSDAPAVLEWGVAEIGERRRGMLCGNA